jgi:hypothetical protein
MRNCSDVFEKLSGINYNRFWKVSVLTLKKISFFVILTSLLMFSWTCVEGCDASGGETHAEIFETADCEDEKCRISANLQILSNKQETIYQDESVAVLPKSFSFRQWAQIFSRKPQSKFCYRQNFRSLMPQKQLRI